MISAQEGAHPFRFWAPRSCRQDVNGFAGLLRSDDLRAGVTRRRLAKHFSGLGFERRVKRKRAMRQPSKPWDSSCSGESSPIRTRIVANRAVAQAMRLKTMPAPDASNGHVRGPELPGQASAAPSGRAVIGATLRPLQNARFEPGRVLGRSSVWALGDQTGQTLGAEAVGPTLHVGSAASQRSRRRANAPSAGKFQNDSGAPRNFGPHSPHPSSPLQFPILYLR